METAAAAAAAATSRRVWLSEVALMELLLLELRACRMARRLWYWAAAIFAAADGNGDGFLTLPQFALIFRGVQPVHSERELQQVFGRLTAQARTQALSAATFRLVVRQLLLPYTSLARVVMPLAQGHVDMDGAGLRASPRRQRGSGDDADAEHYDEDYDDEDEGAELGVNSMSLVLPPLPHVQAMDAASDGLIKALHMVRLVGLSLLAKSLLWLTHLYSLCVRHTTRYRSSGAACERRRQTT